MRSKWFSACKLFVVLSLVFMGSGFQQADAKDESASRTKVVKVPIKDAKGKQIGEAALSQLDYGVQIKIEVKGLTPGLHGIHFHENGKCEPPEFKTAGDHFNPGHKHHGLLNPEGPHVGDLPNLVVDSKGYAVMQVISKLVTLNPNEPNSLLKPGGTSMVIHAQEDDEKTDPSGNSGARIACGVIN
ncbi:superoxide dismutase family protein [Paenibacillus albiflavus]|uniref:Superoxide dismutase [Cu-Zn] n=2 Tax=Paenibacillus albiflavus TaxID=2545760 RepID=A0A4R4E002_9BACL|nr:superoxide dismutase family protein [Paenibacillus albiflavus]